MNITNIHHCLIKGKIIDIPFKQSCTKSLHYVCTMYMLTTTSYFATTSTLNYCILICAWVGGLIFGNKTIYIYISPKMYTEDSCSHFNDHMYYIGSVCCFPQLCCLSYFVSPLAFYTPSQVLQNGVQCSHFHFPGSSVSATHDHVFPG